MERLGDIFRYELRGIPRRDKLEVVRHTPTISHTQENALRSRHGDGTFGRERRAKRTRVRQQTLRVVERSRTQTKAHSLISIEFARG